MFIPNQVCDVRRRTSWNKHGEPVYGPTQVVPVAVVHLIDAALKTTVRADSSASRGAADEVVSETKLLFPKNFRPQRGDCVVLQGIELFVTSVELRFSVHGKLDHHETLLSHRKVTA